MASSELQGKTIAILAADGVEQVELEQPRDAVTAAGADAHLVSLQAGTIQAVESDMNPTEELRVDKVVADVSVDDYHALILPGGCINPDNLRQDADAVAFVRAFADAGKPIAAICHGPWTLIEAGLVKDRTLTSYPSLKTDIENAGGTRVDEEVHVSAGVITSRDPDDLDAFCARLVEEFAKG